jgi:chemotaxis protein methyltransferase CheR
LIEKITRERGFQCSSYKDKCLRRRIAVRMRARGASGCAEYSAILDSDAHEYDRLMRSLTVNVTKFFRNWETYSAVSEKIVPALMDGRQREVRVWSAGCATGEEPMSIAILMHRHAAGVNGLDLLDSVSIVGTDIDRTCLDHAERGVYQESALGDTPPDIRDEYFREASGFVTVLPEARRLVRYGQADLLHFRAPVDSPHLILCRNVVIYFERAAQDALFAHFYETLAPGGYLVLGKVETLLGPTRALFRPVNARERIFQKT